jgi:hypothetical protein
LIVELGLQLVIRPTALAIDDGTVIKLLETVDQPGLLLFEFLSIPNQRGGKGVSDGCRYSYSYICLAHPLGYTLS